MSRRFNLGFAERPYILMRARLTHLASAFCRMGRMQMSMGGMKRERDADFVELGVGAHKAARTG